MALCIDIYFNRSIGSFIQFDQDEYLRRIAVIRGSCNHGYGPLRYKLSGGGSNRRPHPATKSLRKRYEGPSCWEWLTYREERCHFSFHVVAPCFLTVVRRVDSQTSEGGIGAPPFLASEWFIGIRIDPIMSARDHDACAGAAVG